MNLKYYLRGLGIGILVTLLIMNLSGKNHAAVLTDEQIRQEAKKLGMVDGTNVLTAPEKEKGDVQTTESGVLSQTADSASEELPEEDRNTNSSVTVLTSKELQDKLESADEAVSSGDETGGTKTETEPSDDSEQAKESRYDGKAVEKDKKEIVITVDGGDSSYKVAAKLADAGLIADAGSYDSFLCQNGYDKKLFPGDYSIPEGADEKTIANILTGETSQN